MRIENYLYHCTKLGIPKIENKNVKHLMTVIDVHSAHRKEKTYLLYSSTLFNKKLFLVLVGRGPLKSILSLSNGCISFIRCASAGL